MYWVKMNERKKREELGELLGLEPVTLIIRKSRQRWFGYFECKDDIDWVYDVDHCIDISGWKMLEVGGISQRGCPKKTWWGCVKNDMESLGLSKTDTQFRSIWSKRTKGATG